MYEKITSHNVVMFAIKHYDNPQCEGEKEFEDDLGVKDLWGEKGFTTNERTGIRPTLELNGIWGGYQGEGAKTVLPSKATAKISALDISIEAPSD